MAAPNQHERRVVAGLFQDPRQAERAIRELRAAGFDDDDIAVAVRDRAQREMLDERTDVDVTDNPVSAAKGGAGGLMDRIASWFEPDRSGSLAGALADQGFSDAEARHFDQGFQAGMILVTVRAGDRAEQAWMILRNAGADLGQPTPTGTPAGPPVGTSADLTEAERLRLYEEELRVAKERVQTGEVRIGKEVVTERREIDVPVTREEVVIERHPVTGEAARAGDRGDLREGEEIRIPVTEEQVRVEKTPVVKEELTVGKRQVQDTERVRETVRREEAHVETAGTTNVWSGKERRRRADASYAGPERRVAHA